MSGVRLDPTASRVRRGRGPTGLYRPPFTPNYSTPATTQVATLEALQGALNTASAGNVIEVTANLFEATERTLLPNANSAGWVQNVLVRPPIGTRLTTSSIDMQCHNVTFAGFDLLGGFRIRRSTSGSASNGSGSALWRAVGLSETGFLAMSADNSGMYEVVAAKTAIDKNMTDRSNFAGSADAFDNTITMQGCFIAGIIRGLEPSVANLIPETTVSTTQSAGKTLATATVGAGGYTISGAVVNIEGYPGLTDATFTQTATLGINVNGTRVHTFTVPSSVTQPRSWAVVSNTGINLATVQGDVVTVIIDSVGAGLTALPFRVAVGTQSFNHSDTTQCVRSGGNSGGYVKNIRMLDSIIEGSSNAACQFVAGASGNQYAGDMVLYNSTIVQSGAHGINMGQPVTGGGVVKAGYDHIIGSDIGRIVFDSTAPITFKHNKSTQMGIGAQSFTAYDSTNALGGLEVGNQASLRTLQPLPDLAAIWPECPFTGVAR